MALPSLALRAKRIPWKTVFFAGQQLYERGRRFRDNLTDAERKHLGELLRKSKGRRSNLTDREYERVKSMVIKGFRGFERGR